MPDHGPVIMETEMGRRLSGLGLIAGFVGGLPNLFFPIIAIYFGAGRSEEGAAYMPLIIGGILIFSALMRWLKWLRFRYFLGAQEIRIESGLLNRTARSIPFERIQDVSIEQKPVARIFDLAAVRFETGSGAGDDGTLSYVTLNTAEDLRALVRAKKSGIAESGNAAENIGAQAEHSPPIFAMDLQRVLTLGFYSFSLVIFAVLGGVAQQFDFLLPDYIWDWRYWLDIAGENGAALDKIGLYGRIMGALAALAGLILIGLGTGIIRTLLREYGFRLDHNEKGFRRRRGLLTLTDTNMPARRVQAAVINTGPIRKRRGWHGLSFISLASDGSGKEQDASNHSAAPLAQMEEILPILQAAQIYAPDAAVDFRRGKASYWMAQFLLLMLPIIAAVIMLINWQGFGQSALFFLAPPFLFLPLLLLRWRRYFYALDNGHIFVRRGWWNQKLTIAPQIKIQSAEIAQGPILRLLGLARLHLGLAGGRLAIVALPLAHAHMLRAQIVDEMVKQDYSAIAADY